MGDKRQNEYGEIVIAFVVGIFIDALLLAIIGVIPGLRSLLIVVFVIVIAHLACSVGLTLYRGGQLEDSDFDFVRFGLLFVFWYLAG